MKKRYGIILVLLLMIFTGCTKVESGKYLKGTYFGSVQYESYGAKYVTTAVVYINDDGLIKSVFIDSTFNSNSVATTKKVLGDAYGMKSAAASGNEWYQQVEIIENKVVEKQGTDWVKWTDEGKTKLDSVSGVTITANTYIEAVNKALEKAIKEAK